MKKYIFMAAALMMMGMGMSSCSNNDEITEVEQAPKKVQLTLTASFDMDGETRAVWGTDGLTPKFERYDQVGVYSDNSASVEHLMVTTVDGAGNATLTGSVTAATEYHLVFPYQAGTTYDSSSKKITGFANFQKETYQSGYTRYPSTALHYFKVTSSTTTASFKPLCAILKISGENNPAPVYIASANITNPVIKIEGYGHATVEAEQKRFNDSESMDCLLHPGQGDIICFPVAPGQVELKPGLTDHRSKSGAVRPGKIYNVNISDY